MSIHKISKELGLSSATVSWILSGQGEQRKFKEETIKRVKEYAESINYSPNLVARNLSKGSTKTIGVVIPYISDTYYASIVQEIENQVHLCSYNLTICSSTGSPSKEANIIEQLLNQRVDGVILATVGGCEESIKKLIDRKCPFVLLDRRSTKEHTNFVVPNNHKCSYELTVKLAQQGAKKIAIVTSDSQLSAMQERFNGYTEGLKESRLSFDESLIVDIDRVDYDERGPKMIKELLEKDPEIDGLFFTTHYLALNAIKYFCEQGIDYNSRFKMATIYNSVWLKLLAPSIIVANVPIKEISKNTVDILFDSIKDKKLPLRQMILENNIV